MSPTTIALLAVAVVLVASWVSWTAGRLDRQHARVDAAWSALDAQLVRRAAAARALVPLLPDAPTTHRLERVAHDAVEAGEAGREQVENDLTRALLAVLDIVPAGPAREELAAASTRVGLARAVHGSAVTDARSLRRRPVVRLLRLSGHRALPTYVEFDDTALS